MVASSDKLLRACTMFGRTPDELRARAAAPSVRDIARQLDELLQPGEVALITGPSGGGKSTILRELSRRCECVTVPQDRPPHVPPSTALRTRCSPNHKPSLIDLFSSDLGTTLSHLARAGLADATILPLTLDELSEGQRFRAHLALAMDRIEGGTALQSGVPDSTNTLLIDEFASTLDRTTARTLAQLINRYASRTNIRIVCATAHDDLLGDLRPAVLIHQPLLRAAAIARSPWLHAPALSGEDLA